MTKNNEPILAKHIRELFDKVKPGNKEIQDIFISRIGFNLIRVHKYAEILLDKNMDNVSLLNYLKYPTEEIIIYARPKENENGIDSLNQCYVLGNTTSISISNIAFTVYYQFGLIFDPVTNTISGISRFSRPFGPLLTDEFTNSLMCIYGTNYNNGYYFVTNVVIIVVPVSCSWILNLINPTIE